MANPPIPSFNNDTLFSAEPSSASNLADQFSSPKILVSTPPQCSASSVHFSPPPQLAPENRTHARCHLETSRERLNRQLQSFPSMPLPEKWREALTERQDTMVASKVYSYWRLRAEVPSPSPTPANSRASSPSLDDSEPLLAHENVCMEDLAPRSEVRAQLERRIAKHERKRHEINTQKQKALRTQLRCMEAEEQIKFLQGWMKEVVVPPDWDAYWEGLEESGESDEETPVASGAQMSKNGLDVSENLDEGVKEGKGRKMKTSWCLRMPGWLRRSLRAMKNYLMLDSRRRIRAISSSEQKNE